jgi:hypothetical protein
VPTSVSKWTYDPQKDQALLELFPGDSPTAMRLRGALGPIFREQEAAEAWAELLGQAIATAANSPWPDDPEMYAEELGQVGVALENALSAFTRIRDATQSACYEVESARMDLLIEKKLSDQRKKAERDVSDSQGDEGSVGA